MDQSGHPIGDSPPPFDEEARQRLIDVNRALRALHKLLIRTVQSEYERERGPIAGPGALLRLLMEDPFF